MSEKQRKERQARYSLYSTDSEDQVASTHRGLDRCAALLKTLLSPEKRLLQKHHPSSVRRKPASSHASNSRKITTVASKMKDSGTLQPPKPRLPGASRHPPPPTSSPLPSSPNPRQPTTRHPQAKTDGRTVGKPLGNKRKSPRAEAPANAAHRVRAVSQPRVTEPGKTKSARRLLIAHRRLRTEPGRRTGDVGSRSKPATKTSDVTSTTSRGVGNNQRTDEGVHVFTSLGSRNTAQASSVGFSRTQQPQLLDDGSGSAARGSVPSDPYPPETTSVPYAPPPSLGYRYPYAVPPLHFPTPYPYYPSFWPYFHPSAQFAPPISSQGPTSSQTLQPGSAHPPSPLRSSSLPHLPQAQLQSHTRPSLILNSRSNRSHDHHNPDATVTVQHRPRMDHSNKSTPVTTGITMATVETHTTVLTPTDSASASKQGPLPRTAREDEVAQCSGRPRVLHCGAVGAIRLLAEEILRSVADSVARIRRTSGATNAELLTSLRDLEDIQKSYREHLTTLCAQLQDAPGVVGGGIPSSAAGWVDGSSLPSAADWLAQVQQLEAEKSHLLERVVQSEMAYSETKGLLDQAEERAGLLRKDLEEQLLSVKRELCSASETLRTVRGEKMTVEEELERVKAAEVQFTTQTAALKWQVSSLEQQLSDSREELCRSGDQLSAVRCALETGKEERQMLLLSLAEKETELLQAQDRLLGLRQCLAYFLSDIVKSDAPLHHPQHSLSSALLYHVPPEAVQRLQSLVNEGNVEKFLAAYISLPLKESDCSSLSSLHGSPTPINTSSPLLSKSTLRDSLQLTPTHSLQPSPTHSLQPSPTHSTPHAGRDGSLKCAHMNSDINSNATVIGDDRLENTGKAAGKPKAVTPPEKGPTCELRTAREEAARFQQPGGGGAVYAPSHTAASHRDDHPHTPSSKSTASSRNGSGAASVTATDTRSVLTTSSEVEFRRDLASLDADIARLQMQFRVAMQRQPQPTHL